MSTPRNSTRRKPRLSPSTNTSDFWIFAHAATGIRDGGEKFVPGKWLIFCKRDQVDGFWCTIKKAVRDGRLWEAKVSTAKTSSPEKHVICAYTKNSRDKEDIFRSREILIQLGFTWKLPYKSDDMTAAGQSGSTYNA